MREIFEQVPLSEIVDEDSTSLIADGDWIESKDQDPNGDVRLIQLADVGDGIFKNVSRRYLTKEKAAKLNCTYLKKGDLLIARMPDPIGRCAIFPDINQSAVTAVDVCIVRPGANVVRQWLMQAINMPQVRYRMNALAGGGTRQRISTSELKALKLPRPSLAEQRKTAAILRTWDEALEKLNALRAAKAQRMDGMAQLLLAPSRAIGTDIPPSNWSLSNFGELFEERQDRNSGLTVDDVVTVGKYAIRKQSEHFTRSVASKDLSNYWTISPGDFVYDPMSAYYGAIGRYLGASDGIVSPAYRVIRLNDDHDPDFIAALLKAHHIRFLLEARSSQGNKEGKRRLLQRDEFESIEFKLPSKEVQSEIAHKLSVFQTDLDLADAEIKALTDQKRGLMQKLLTGEWRVDVSDDEEAAA
jgi:type I restriction enzyme S subunit